MKDAMETTGNAVIGVIVLIIIACLWLFSESYQLPFQNEVTVYNLFCPGELKQDKCTVAEHTSLRVTYKALVDAQAAIYQREEGLPERLEHCAVQNAKNWKCRRKLDGDIEYQWRMLDGDFSEGANSPNYPKSIFYAVPKWRWYLVRYPAISTILSVIFLVVLVVVIGAFLFGFAKDAKEALFEKPKSRRELGYTENPDDP